MITKLLTIPLLLASLIACTKQSPQGGDVSQPEDLIQIDTQSIVIDSNDENDNEPILFRIDTKPGSKARKRLYIRNSTSDTILLADLSGQLEDPSFGAEFSLVRNVCRSTLGVGRSCYLDIQVSGDVSDKNGLILFLVDGRNDELSDPFVLINVEADEEYAVEESSEDALIKSTEVISFGVVGEGKSSTKRIYFSNTNEVVSIDKPVLPTLPTGVIVGADSCPAKIEALSSCYVDFLYSHQLSGNLTLNETVILSSDKLAAKNLTFQGSSVVSADPNAVKLSISTINIPAKTVAGKEYVNRIYISNTSSSSLLIDGSSIISGATVEKNTCSVNLRPGRYCYIDISNTPTVNNQSFPPVTANIPEGNISNEVIRPGSDEGGGETCSSIPDDESCQSSEIAGGCAWDYDFANEGANQSCQTAPSCSDILDDESCGGAEIGNGCFWDYDFANEGANQSCKSNGLAPTCDNIDTENACGGAEINSGCVWAEVTGVEGQTGYCYPKESSSVCSNNTDTESLCNAVTPGFGVCLYDTQITGQCFHTNNDSKLSAESSTSGFNGSSIREPSFGSAFRQDGSGRNTFWGIDLGNAGDGNEAVVIFWNGSFIINHNPGTEAAANSLGSLVVGDYTYYKSNVQNSDPRGGEYRVYREHNTRSQPVGSNNTGSPDGGEVSSGGEEGPPPGGEEG